TRLQRDGQPAVGRGAVLGKTVWDVQHKFRIVVGPLAWERFAALLPDGKPLEQLRALVRQYVGFEFAWDLRLILRRDDVPSWTLASSRDRRVGRLGRTAWLNGGRNFRRAADADELIMNVESIRLGPDLRVEAAA
ncbi:MAG: type VI secretion system baseplate subunit TssG, partial [Caldimonas sp.]